MDDKKEKLKFKTGMTQKDRQYVHRLLMALIDTFKDVEKIDEINEKLAETGHVSLSFEIQNETDKTTYKSRLLIMKQELTKMRTIVMAHP